jgi:LuxR family transcriptional regulator, maltose regulon positive regulatory protein
VVAGPLVETKLFLPKPRGDAVGRPRLTELLEQGRRARLILVSAPAGFGKTTLLARWLAEAEGLRSVAWLSLEDADSEPARFWTYLVTAVQRAVPEVGASALALLQTRQPALDTVLATLINDLSATPTELDVVLDDYHLVDTPDLQSSVAYLLDHLPPQVHLVISTRVDPALPLARLRVRGELVEIRAADLRFTLDEAAAYLNDVAALDLTSADIAALETRTEGWIAALQLAALSLRGRDDTGAFIATFAGDDRYIVDYLAEEVLSRQPPEVRDFLLQTSILDRLSGPLCQAVTGNTASQDMLEQLDRANLFLVPLDGTRRWYRYHHLFAEVLTTHLSDGRPEQVTELHRRASRWYDETGDPVPAVRHAVAAGDVDRAADLAELAIPALQRDRQEATVAAWLEVIPDEVVQTRPVLAFGFIAALMSNGQFTGVDERIHDLEQHLSSSSRPDNQASEPAPGTTVVDRRQWDRLPAALELHRSGLALIHGDPDAAIAHADRATSIAAEDDHLTRAGAAATAGLARWAGGDLEEAHRSYARCVDGLRRDGHISDVLGCSITLADIRITQGRLTDALRTYQDALRLAEDDPLPVTRGTADMHVGISDVACERHDLATAARHLQLSREIGDAAGLPQNPYRWRAAEARLNAVRGNLARALELLDEAEQVYFGDFAPNVRPIAARRARLHLALGDLASATSWAAVHGLAADDDLTYMREFEHITLAMVLLAQRSTGHPPAAVDAARRLLERLLAAADAGGRMGNVIEILVQLALACQADGDRSRATDHLGRALALGQAEGHLRVFLDAGPALNPVLHGIGADSPGAEHARAVLSAAEQEPARPDGLGNNRATTPARPLVDSLSERELDVLRLLGSDLGGPDIARELSVSVNTVRTHTRHIYAKLGVTTRREAVREAARLGLLHHTGR